MEENGASAIQATTEAPETKTRSENFINRLGWVQTGGYKPMTLKKMLLVVGMALTAVAFAAPAMAQASDEWYTHVSGQPDKTLGTTTATGDTAVFKGTLTSTKFPLKQTCEEVTAHTVLWNHVKEETHTATGEVTKLTFDKIPCTVAVLTGHGYTDVAGCEITEVNSTFPTPWHVNVATGTNGIDIVGANFTNTYNGCGALGIPNGAKLGASGTATGTWNNANGCIEFNNSGDLKNPAEEAVTLDGSVCTPGLTLK